LDGRFRSEEERRKRDRDFEDWLDEKPGRRGGFERALTADRDENGSFLPDPY
jgi:hypothetical protein